MDRPVKQVETHAERRQRYAVAGELLDLEVESHGRGHADGCSTFPSILTSGQHLPMQVLMTSETSSPHDLIHDPSVFKFSGKVAGSTSEKSPSPALVALRVAYILKLRT